MRFAGDVAIATSDTTSLFVKGLNLLWNSLTSLNPLIRWPTLPIIQRGVRGQLVLLQTARALALNEDGRRSSNVRVLFDTGSQRSYITDNLTDRLRLKPPGKERIHLDTFGDYNFRSKTCNVVAVCLRRPNESEVITIRALSFPTICSSLPNLVKLDEFPHLSGLDLADPPSSGPEGIDILIGFDYYWNIVGEEVVWGDSGPTVVSSKLGWLLSGTIPTDTHYSSTMSHLALCQVPAVSVQSGHTDYLKATLKSLWETESVGIKEPCDTDSSKELFLNEINFNQCRYEVNLPWSKGSHSLQFVSK